MEEKKSLMDYLNDGCIFYLEYEAGGDSVNYISYEIQNKGKVIKSGLDDKISDDLLYMITELANTTIYDDTDGDYLGEHVNFKLYKNTCDEFILNINRTSTYNNFIDAYIKFNLNNELHKKIFIDFVNQYFENLYENNKNVKYVWCLCSLYANDEELYDKILLSNHHDVEFEIKNYDYFYELLDAETEYSSDDIDKTDYFYYKLGENINLVLNMWIKGTVDEPNTLEFKEKEVANKLNQIIL
ncbi:MAG: hypothetical protein QXF12_07945 [Candidatus Aenigmatarchaeota archaeon]